MKQLAGDRDRLKITDIDPITTVVDKVFAEAGRREAQNKKKYRWSAGVCCNRTPGWRYGKARGCWHSIASQTN